MSIEPRHPDLSVARQCVLLDLPRSSYYFAPAGESPENLALMRRIDAQYLKTPFFGSRQMTAWLRRQGHAVNRKRVQRLMRLMGLQGAVPGPHTSRPHPATRSTPTSSATCSLATPTSCGRPISPTCRCRWGSCTWWPSSTGTAAMCSPGRLSNTLDTGFCLEALDSALA